VVSITERSVYNQFQLNPESSTVIYRSFGNQSERQMPRPRAVEETDLIAHLARVFSEVGYEGASLTLLSQATGLQKASLYHRFPGGKQQMAEEVLYKTADWLKQHILQPLAGSEPPEARLAIVVANLDIFYHGGVRACLLNMLSAPRVEEGPFGTAIRSAFEALIDGFATLAEQAGATNARVRAERAVMLLQGALVLSRGLGTPQPFQSFLADLPAQLLPRH
jgi:TetR/AcrR family transcriptional regulator, lmrAB and yxaGH operons repressor